MVTLSVPSDLRGGESGCNVVVEEAESSRSSDRDDGGRGEDSRIEDRVSALSPCLDRIFCVMRLWEKVVLWGWGVVEYSSTVDRIAVVISSLDV